MDFRSSPPFPGKTQLLKPRATRKPVQESKMNSKEPQVSRQRRVFGTVKNPNIPAKSMPDKPIKPSISDKKTEPKSLESMNMDSNRCVKTKDNSTKKSKKKSTCFQSQKHKENNDPNSSHSKATMKLNENEAKTPVAMASSSCKKLIIGTRTPYHSAQNCSKCRFDRLETSSYWLAQIKLADSVSKHFVSASFFRLASESKAEPIGNLWNELKRYLLRHEHLRKETEWKEVSISYGLMPYKEDENSNSETSQTVMESAADLNSNDVEGA